jgi:hypothetical protein
MKPGLYLNIFLALSMQTLGCGGFDKWVRQYTYPPDFRYITPEELHSTMWQLAYHSRELNRLMRLSGNPQLYRGEILEQLRGMEQTAAKLNQSGWPTNHPLVDMNLANFRNDIRIAREAVEREPPNFLLASPLTGACVYCHSGH